MFRLAMFFLAVVAACHATALPPGRSAWAMVPSLSAPSPSTPSAARSWVPGVAVHRADTHPRGVRLAIPIGLLGGFTTFSSFAYETIRLTDDGQFGLAALNLLLSNGLGLAAAWLGARLAVALYGA